MAKTEKELCTLMERVNDYWIGQNPETGDCAWERAAYFLGNMAAYEILKSRNIWNMPSGGRRRTAGIFTEIRRIRRPTRMI